MSPTRVAVGLPRKPHRVATDAPTPTVRFLHPRTRHRLRDPDHPIALADPTRLPLGTGSVDELTLEGDLLPDEVPDTLRECARILAPGGTLTAHLRPADGWRTFLRRCLHAFFQLPDTPDPTAFPNLLLPLAFDRIEILARKRHAVCKARRLPGRPWDAIAT